MSRKFKSGNVDAEVVGDHVLLTIHRTPRNAGYAVHGYLFALRDARHIAKALAHATVEPGDKGKRGKP